MTGKSEKFFLGFVVAIIAARVFVALFPGVNIFIGDFHFHHIYLGIVGVILFRLLNVRTPELVGFGYGLIADEIALLFLTDGSIVSYWSILSVFGVVALTITTFLFKKKVSGILV